MANAPDIRTRCATFCGQGADVVVFIFECDHVACEWIDGLSTTSPHVRYCGYN